MYITRTITTSLHFSGFDQLEIPHPIAFDDFHFSYTDLKQSRLHEGIDRFYRPTHFGTPPSRGLILLGEIFSNVSEFHPIRKNMEATKVSRPGESFENEEEIFGRFLNLSWKYGERGPLEDNLDNRVHGIQIDIPLFGEYMNTEHEIPEELRDFYEELFVRKSIIIEQSPPSLESVKALTQQGAGVAVGTYVGFEAGEGAPLVLIIAVPTGILLCSAAIGAARALEKGIEKMLEQKLKGKNSLED
jgi:hypothetical protein